MTTRVLGRLTFFIYIIAAVFALAVWAPKFLMANLQTTFQWNDYRYLTMSAVPLGLFLISIIAVQALLKRFSLLLILEIVLVVGTWVCGLITFEYPPQANLFCPLHVWSAVVLFFVNLRWYRKLLDTQVMK